MKILGIETSCDETSAGVIEAEKSEQTVKILTNIVSSSVSLHAKTGGIIPEIAAREQVKFIIPVVDAALKQETIDAIAVTVGPGLIGSLLVGVETARTLSCIWNKPIIPVNHLIGHIYANFINYPQQNEQISIEFPAIALIVSGGHTDIVFLKAHKKIEWISGTRDDAAGEAFDKIGRLLGLAYPAGPAIEKLAKNGNPKTFRFPRPLLHENTLDFSFSGLKTAALREIQKIETNGNKTPDKLALNSEVISDFARAIQDAIIDVLVKKTLKVAEILNVKSILLSGGVAANQTLRETFKKTISEENLPYAVHVPDKSLCTDNAAMIASAAFFQGEAALWQEVATDPELYFD